MKKKWKRVIVIALALLMVIMLLPLGSFKAQAEEGEDDSKALGTTYKVGDIIKFGHYEQDNNKENGKEEIEWQVLDVQSNRVLVISKYILENKAYKSSSDDGIWESCDLRAWLNDDFYNTAFDETEKEKISETSIVSTDVDNLSYDKTGTPVSKNTVDKIFCLSLEEVERYFGDYQLYQEGKYRNLGYNYNLICAPTEYVTHRVRTDDLNNCFTITEDLYYKDYIIPVNPDPPFYDGDPIYTMSDIYPTSVIGICCMSWWLRSPTDSYSCDSSYVKTMGKTGYLNGITDIYVGVRPALYINTTNSDPVDPKPIYPVEIKYEGYTTTFDPSMLSIPSTAGYDPYMAQVCSFLCQSIYRVNVGDEDKELFNQMGIFGYKTFSEKGILTNMSGDGDYFIYSVGYKDMMINGEDTNVLFFVLRGSKSVEEFVKDAFSDTCECSVGSKEYLVYKYCTDFGSKVTETYNELLNEYPRLKQKPMKIIITGHSLGGAAANFVGAVFSDKANETSLFDKKDVYVYTFGAIDSMPVDKTGQNGSIAEGYENIHNIYNFNDTFGPNGWILFTARGNSGYGKFGHMDIFPYNLAEIEKHREYFDGIFDVDYYLNHGNHSMLKSYMPAVFKGWVKHDKKWRIVSVHCPVDINVYKDGKLGASVVNNTIDDNVTTIPTNVIGDEKYFLVDEDSVYRFEISATAGGEMSFDVSNSDTGNEYKEFQTVSLTPDKKMVSFVDSKTETEDIKLFVEDESGKIVTEVKEDGSEIPATVQSIFKDVKDGAWYVSSVQYVYDKDIMTGKGDQIFAPNTNLKREEFTQMLYKNEGKPAITITDNPFTDVKNAWYKDSVLWAKEKGIVSGKSATLFGIGKNITREELALMLYKYAQYKNFDVSVKDSTDLSTFTDTGKVSSWAVNAIKWAVERGIISGKGNATNGYRIDPQKGATRAECAAMMKKFAEVYDGAELTILEAEEEPLVLPEEDIEDLPVPADETDDVIIDEDEETEDEDVPSEDEKDTDESEINPEEKSVEENEMGEM